MRQSVGPLDYIPARSKGRRMSKQVYQPEQLQALQIEPKSLQARISKEGKSMHVD